MYYKNAGMDGTIPDQPSFIVNVRSERALRTFNVEYGMGCNSTSVGSTRQAKTDGILPNRDNHTERV